MASPAQIAANRLNAQKSTGPRTDTGKATSRMNAIQHGIDAHSAVLPGEDPDELAALAENYRDRFQPHGAEQVFLVETLIQSDWRRRRYLLLEAELTNRLLGEMDPEERSLAALYMPGNPGGRAIERAVRHYETADRAWFRAFTQLTKLKEKEAQLAIARAQMAAAREDWLRSRNSPEPAPQPQIVSHPVPPAPGRPAAASPENLALRL